MKKLFFVVMLLSMTRTIYAQCPDNATDDVRVVYARASLVSGGLYFNLCSDHSLHNELIFRPARSSSQAQKVISPPRLRSFDPAPLR